MAADEAAGGAAETFDPAHAEEYRAYLMRYALIQLRDHTAAEDAVQETLLAALQSTSRFAGRSSIKTWLVGIPSTRSSIRTAGRRASSPSQARRTRQTTPRRTSRTPLSPRTATGTRSPVAGKARTGASKRRNSGGFSSCACR
jgi:DNA-directed RNA polymerase specialized sigma24 family protein